MVTGILIAKLEPKTGSGANGQWIIQEFVIETDGQYPKKIAIEAWNDKASIIQNTPIGAKITLDYSVESKEYNGKWYTKAKLFKVESTSVADYGNANTPIPTANIPPSSDSSDLPF